MANTYLIAWKNMMQGNIDLEGGSIQALLLETGATFDETDETVTEVLTRGGGELDAVTGYERQTLAAPSVSIVGTIVKFSSAYVVFTDVDSSDTAIAMLIFYNTGSDATSIPICYCDGVDEVFESGNLKEFTYECPTDGWINVDNS